MPVSDLAFNIWGVVSSVLGTIALTPVFLGWLKPRLPTSMIADVLDIYKETQDLFATALRDGLITNPDEMNHFKANLLDATISVDRLRAEVYLIETWRQDLSKWWRGLSGRIWILRENLNSVRAELAQRSSNERLKLAAQIRKSETSSGLEDSGLASSGTACREVHLDSPPGLPAASLHGLPSHDPNLVARLGGSECLCSQHHSGMCASMSPYPYHHWQEHFHHTPPPCYNHSPMGCASDSDRHACRSHRDSCTAAQTPRPLNAEADLQSLFSLVLSRPRRWFGAQATRARAGKAHLRSGRQPRGSFAAGTKGTSPSATPQNAMHPHLRELLRLVRRAYGVDLGAYAHDRVHRSDSRVVLDPESLTPQHLKASDAQADDDSEDWEEECQ